MRGVERPSAATDRRGPSLPLVGAALAAVAAGWAALGSGLVSLPATVGPRTLAGLLALALAFAGWPVAVSPSGSCCRRSAPGRGGADRSAGLGRGRRPPVGGGAPLPDGDVLGAFPLCGLLAVGFGDRAPLRAAV